MSPEKKKNVSRHLDPFLTCYNNAIPQKNIEYGRVEQMGIIPVLHFQYIQIQRFYLHKDCNFG